jgi:acetate kinase
VVRLTRTLVVNAGSSTLKLSVIGPGDEVDVAVTVGASDREAVRRFCNEQRPIDASGHRIVHGGADFTGPVALDAATFEQLAALEPLAPLHQRPGLEAARMAMAELPGVPAFACFDTAFHATLPAPAATYPVPAEWRERWGIRRYGFHGLSHQWASGRALEIAALPVGGSRLVTCHLGSGSSACAVAEGRSVDTTMGFTPLEGLVMATRSGTVDPGLVLWLLRAGGLAPREVEDALERQSGLAALSGTDGDMRTITAAADAEDDRARLAIDIWVHRLCGAIASMTSSLGGLDALVFTGGIGEHAPELRLRVVDRLSYLGLELDEEANRRTSGDGDVSAGGSRVRTLVVASHEDVQIARLIRGLDQNASEVIRNRRPET